LQEYEEGCLFLVDSDGSWVPIAKETWDDIITAVDQGYMESSGQPTVYAVTGGYFRLRPIPDAVYSTKMLYYKKDTTLSTGDTTNLWLTHAPEVLISETGIKMAPYVQNAALMQMFQSTFERAWTRLQVANSKRKHVNADYRMAYGG
jgi:hypothetical protein